MLWKLGFLSFCLILFSCTEKKQPQRGAGARFCREDVKKFCSHITPGEGRISDCMRINRDKVSEACRNHLSFFDKKFDDTFMATMNVCKEHEVICGHVQKYGARRINCVKQVYLKTPEKLSAECRERFSKIVDLVPPISR